MNHMIIGISGKMRHGKDTFASYLTEILLQEGYNSMRVNMADQLKMEIANHIAPVMGLGYYDCLKEMNSDGVKEDYRLLMQWWGTEFRRNRCGEDYWVEKLKDACENMARNNPQANGHLLFFVSDIRFKNEADFIKRNGGTLIRVNRPGIAISDHPSESELDGYCGFDFIANNAGGLSYLKSEADDIAMHIIAGLGK